VCGPVLHSAPLPAPSLSRLQTRGQVWTQQPHRCLSAPAAPDQIRRVCSRGRFLGFLARLAQWAGGIAPASSPRPPRLQPAFGAYFSAATGLFCGRSSVVDLTSGTGSGARARAVPSTSAYFSTGATTSRYSHSGCCHTAGVVPESQRHYFPDTVTDSEELPQHPSRC
jgi:hypothetical protein